jgi:predicted nucleic acid-binding protein
VKVFFDTNVYIAEALLGQVAEELLKATEHASWRIYASSYVLEELERVLTDKLRFSRRLAHLSRTRIIRRAKMVAPRASRHAVQQDPADSPILSAR